MLKQKSNIVIFIWTIISIILYTLVAFDVERTNTVYLLSAWSLLFVGYFYVLSKKWSDSSISILVFVAIIFRLIFLISTPTLSDDYFRFIWDGLQIANETNPFSHLPSEVVTDDEYLQTLYVGLNSPNYYSVYPPIMQGIFWVAVKLFPNSILGCIIVMRSFLILAEIGSILIIKKLLEKWQLPKQRVLIYALNPLVIIELVGNLHFESLMIFFLLLSILLLTTRRIILAGIAFAASVCVKIVPLIILPLLIKKIKFKQFLLFSTTVAIVVLLPFGIMLNNEILFSNFFKSINLYFQNFEFNASIFYIIREIGFYIKGYDVIGTAGKILPVIFVAFFLWMLLRDRQKQLSTFWATSLWVLLAYYALALIVHPWYISLLLVCTVFTHYRFPILWTGLVGFTYITYASIPYQENLWVVLIEYLCVFSFILLELRNQKTITKSLS